MGGKEIAMKTRVSILFLFAAALAAISTQAQNGPERTAIALSDPSRPATVQVELFNGNIEVQGYSGRDVVVEAYGGGSLRNSHPPEHAEGLHRLDSNSATLNVDQAANVVAIKPGPFGSITRLSLKVPYSSMMKLKTMNGDITVDQISGDAEVESYHGTVKLTGISGAALVHSMSGKINAVFARVSETKAVSLSSLNGDVDVTLPANARVNLRAKTDNGGVYTNFDVKLQPDSGMKIEMGRGHGLGGFERATVGTINGGGAELQLSTFNGNIYIRKAM
jgi:DUF4097 and DUF4098 domain-containing protein YvlB